MYAPHVDQRAKSIISSFGPGLQLFYPRAHSTSPSRGISGARVCMLIGALSRAERRKIYRRPSRPWKEVLPTGWRPSRHRAQRHQQQPHSWGDIPGLHATQSHGPRSDAKTPDRTEHFCNRITSAPTNFLLLWGWHPHASKKPQRQAPQAHGTRRRTQPDCLAGSVSDKKGATIPQIRRENAILKGLRIWATEDPKPPQILALEGGRAR